MWALPPFLHDAHFERKNGIRAGSGPGGSRARKGLQHMTGHEWARLMATHKGLAMLAWPYLSHAVQVQVR